MIFALGAIWRILTGRVVIVGRGRVFVSNLHVYDNQGVLISGIVCDGSMARRGLFIGHESLLS